MNDKQINDAVKQLRSSEKKNFKQTIDLVFTLKDLDLKKPENQLEFFVTLHGEKGKTSKICAFVDADMIDNAKTSVDTVISVAEFDKYAKDKKLAKKLSEQHEFFIAQANIMPKVATSFGRVLGPRGKMPNPKAGCIFPPNANLKALNEKLQKTLKISNKKGPYIQTIVGNEATGDDVIIHNVKDVFNAVVHHMPQGENNIKSVIIKYTMGKPVKLM